MRIRISTVRQFARITRPSMEKPPVLNTQAPAARALANVTVNAVYVAPTHRQTGPIIPINPSIMPLLAGRAPRVKPDSKIDLALANRDYRRMMGQVDNSGQRISIRDHRITAVSHA